MEDFQFELNGLPFGYHLPIRVKDDGFDPTPGAIRNQDTDNQQGSGRLFGIDRFGGAKWTWTGFLDESDVSSGLARLRQLQVEWRREHTDPTDIDIVRYQLDGQVRRVYGRSRRFSATLDNRLLVGNVPWVGDFDCIDDLTYEDVERQTTVTIVPPSSGGFYVPFTTPISTVSNGLRQGAISNVGGDALAPFVLSIKGPLNEGAVVAGQLWKIVTARAIADFETLVVDTTPWGMGVTIGGDPVSGALSPRTTRLGDARLNPAGDYISIDGVSINGNASAAVRWRPASIAIS